MRLRWRSAAALFALLLAAAGCVTSPITGRKQLLLFPEGMEVQMGLQSFQKILSKSKISRDRAKNAALQRVGRRVAAATGKRNYKWEFVVIENKALNAFALPGGKVAVHTGMFPVAGNDAGLATVVAHEVAHAITRHGGERMSQNLIVQIGLAAVQSGMRNNDPQTVRQVTALLGAGVSVGILLPFSRDQESEADRVGLICMAKAGYDPRAARDFWIRMMRSAKGKGAPPEFLSTHPAHQTRIRQIESWIPEAMRHYRPRRR